MNTPSSPRGALLLLHRGYSFVEDLAAVVRARGLEVYILSSRPADPQRVQALHRLGDWLHVTDADNLSEHDVVEALPRLAADGKHVAACLSVWEGARRLMAVANARLGVVDLPPGTIDLVQDKLAFRAHLAQAGLTRVTTQVLTPETLAAAQASGRRAFVKPRHGVASFGAFSRIQDLTWDRLQAMRREMAEDTDYAEILSRTEDFLLEDYIPGREYSFEIVATGGELFLVGVHEKVEIDEADGATLETACVSPPLELTADELAQARAYIHACCRAFDLHSGAFHIEARIDRDSGSWELIEINPRIGGAFINASLKAQRDGDCILVLWLQTLMAQDAVARAELLLHMHRRYDPARAVPGKHRVLFRVYFGTPGKHVVRVTQPTIERPPALIKVLVPDGTRLPKSSREVFVAQALWVADLSESAESIEHIKLISHRAVEIEYAN